MSDELTGRGVGVTIKYGKGFEDPWVTIRGTAREVREDLCAVFGFEPHEVDGIPLSGLVLNASKLAQGKATIVRELGGEAIPPAKPSESLRSENDEAQADPWAAAQAVAEATAEAKPEAKPNKHLYDQIESAETTDALKRLWAENNKVFTDDAELTAAWKAKGKSLKAAK